MVEKNVEHTLRRGYGADRVEERAKVIRAQEAERKRQQRNFRAL